MCKIDNDKIVPFTILSFKKTLKLRYDEYYVGQFFALHN